MKKILFSILAAFSIALLVSSTTTQWKQYHDRKKGMLYADSLYVTSGHGTGSKLVILVKDSTTNKVYHDTYVSQLWAFSGWNEITSGTSSTIGNTVTNTVFNPGSGVIASYTITLPPNPVDGQTLSIHGGGTISGGGTVVTSFTIAANSGQQLIETSAPTTLLSGNCFRYRYRTTGAYWYREQ